MMNSFLVAYIGPETVLPVTSALAAVGGAVMLFGGYVRRKCAAAWNVCFRGTEEDDEDGTTPCH